VWPHHQQGIGRYTRSVELSADDQRFLDELPEFLGSLTAAYARYLHDAAAAERGELDWPQVRERIARLSVEVARRVRVGQGAQLYARDVNVSNLLTALGASLAMMASAERVSDLNDMPLVTPNEVRALLVPLSPL
jgi:hypothetical protein